MCSYGQVFSVAVTFCISNTYLHRSLLSSNSGRVILCSYGQVFSVAVTFGISDTYLHRSLWSSNSGRVVLCSYGQVFSVAVTFGISDTYLYGLSGQVILVELSCVLMDKFSLLQ